MSLLLHLYYVNLIIDFEDAYLCIDVCVGDMTGQGSREDYLAFLCLI